MQVRMVCGAKQRRFPIARRRNPPNVATLMAGFFRKIADFFKRKKLDFDELEEVLISGDIGIRMTTQIIDTLRARQKEIDPEEVIEVAKAEMRKILPEKPFPLPVFTDRPCTVLVVGVNGTGKTTSTAKLALHLKKQGHGVVLAAADTFRAAAIEQLDVWSQRINVPLVKTQYKGDPAAVCFDAWEAASKRQAAYLLCDTAGRLHTKHNLMEELAKIRRILGKKDPTAPHEVLLVVDATTGTNALNQAREFQKALGDISGLIVTKLDGSGKGGVLVSIQQELGIPTRFIGLGEGQDEFELFDREKFLESIF
jgi:fused signal recognition particle receptor